MAKVERIIENNLFDFKNLVSFQTENYVGQKICEYSSGDCEFAIFDKTHNKYNVDMVDTIYANSLKELISEIELYFNEKIVEVYDKHITTVNINTPI